MEIKLGNFNIVPALERPQTTFSIEERLTRGESATE